MKPAFFYATGTAFLLNIMTPFTGSLLSLDVGMRFRLGNQIIGGKPVDTFATVNGINGRSASWDLMPASDPFASLLDPDLWDQRTTITYPASALTMRESILYGRDQMIQKILKLPAGQKFALGGYSQGAGVCAATFMAGLKTGTTGPLESRRADFLGYCGFGNPRRQLGHRGAAGQFGTWSGSWYDDTVDTGSGGCFPTTGDLALLTGCPDNWVEFTAPFDPISSNGTNAVEQTWRSGIEIYLGTNPAFFAQEVLNLDIVDDMAAVFEVYLGSAYGRNAGPNKLIDGAGMKFDFPGGGHTTYPFLGPADSSGVIPSVTETVDGVTYRGPSGDTCYQAAIRFLDDLAKPYQVAPIVLPDAGSVGWSTTLVPPAA